MKLELLKSIINDLHLAGIHDIPGNSAFNADDIEAQDLVQAVFNKTADTNFDNLASSEEFDEQSINNEMTELFAAFGSGKRPDLGKLEAIATKAKKSTKPKKAHVNIIDPRLNKGSATNLDSINAQNIGKKKKEKAVDIDFKPKMFISTKVSDDAKIVLLLPYKDETQLKAKADFKLLENILKAIKLEYQQVSVIFVDSSYKNITLGDKKYDDMLAQELQNEVKLLKQDIILSFGEDCLSLTYPQADSIREQSTKAMDVFESKKLLANYSLSAMVNTPKYKKTTWANLLLIKKL